MKLLQAHEDETQTRFRLLGPKRDAPAAPTEDGSEEATRGFGGEAYGEDGSSDQTLDRQDRSTGG